MIFKNVLAAVDGSAPSNAAVELAVRLAKESAGRLVFCYVLQVPRPVHDAAGFAREQMMEDASRAGREVLDAAARRAADAGLNAEAVMPSGPVADGILDTAKQHGSDVIVMGCHGRSGLVRAVLGSKAADVISRSPIPVLVAPHVQHS